jgi:hypothetical protein
MSPLLLAPRSALRGMAGAAMPCREAFSASSGTTGRQLQLQISIMLWSGSWKKICGRRGDEVRELRGEWRESGDARGAENGGLWYVQVFSMRKRK